MPRRPAPPAGADPRAFCAEVCRALDEPLAGTAPEAAVGWLLVEHPGPWPAFGLPPDLPPALARWSARLLEHSVRTQLIRRPRQAHATGAASPVADAPPGAGPAPDLNHPPRPAAAAAESAGRRILIAGGPPEHRWLERLDPPAAARLVRALGRADGPPPGIFAAPLGPRLGVPQPAALLVCTHGRREVCCALFGRPVAAELTAAFDQTGDPAAARLVWETTHLGGDRFAAGLVLLPAGAYFGRLDPGQARRVAGRALSGELDLDHYRGTAGRPAAAQAAECLLRRALDLTGLDEVRPVLQTAGSGRRRPQAVDKPPGPDAAAAEARVHRFRVRRERMTAPGTGPLRGAAPATEDFLVEVTLNRQSAARPRLTSCGEGSVERPPVYELTAIRTIEGRRPVGPWSPVRRAAGGLTVALAAVNAVPADLGLTAGS